MGGELTEFVGKSRKPHLVARGVREAAKGCRKHRVGGMLKVVILLDEETFEEVSGGAISNGCSFAAQARMLIEVGLETLKEDAR